MSGQYRLRHDHFGREIRMPGCPWPGNNERRNNSHRDQSYETRYLYDMPGRFPDRSYGTTNNENYNDQDLDQAERQLNLLLSALYMLWVIAAIAIVIGSVAKYIQNLLA